MNVHLMTRADLETLEPLLLTSFGSNEFSLVDELEYFPEPAPTDWFWLEAAGKALGFLRYFPSGNNLNIAELFAPDENTIRILLEHFKTHHALGSKLLRIDLKLEQSNLEALIRSHATVDTEKYFSRFELSLPAGSSAKFQPSKTTDLLGVQAVLGVLMDYSLEKIQILLEQGWLRIVKFENVTVAAVHLEPRGNKLEVMSLATHPKFQRRGFARILLETLKNEAVGVCERISLQVNAENVTAIRLYENVGFCEIPQDQELWLYTCWN
jgi:ribosomal protein S18 acetylase RimI-like enzyme